MMTNVKDTNHKLISLTMLFIFICGMLIGYLGSSLYWKKEAEEEIHRVLSGKHFVDESGGLWVTPKAK